MYSELGVPARGSGLVGLWGLGCWFGGGMKKSPTECRAAQSVVE